MGGRGGSSGLNSIMGVNTNGLSGVQVDALKYYAENGKWPAGLSSYQKTKLDNMIDNASGLPSAKDYKESGLTRTETEQAFLKQYNSQAHSATEVAAKEEYMINSDSMNAYLRGQISSYPGDTSSINAIRKSMKTETSDQSLYRGVDGDVLGIKPTDSVGDVRAKLVGKTFRDKGLLSTSMSKDVAKEFSTRGADDSYTASVKTVMVINPKGAKTTMVKSGLSEKLIDVNTPLKYTDVKKQGDTFYVYATYKGKRK